MLPGQRASLAKQGPVMARGLTRTGEVASISMEGRGQSKELGWGVEKDRQGMGKRRWKKRGASE